MQIFLKQKLSLKLCDKTSLQDKIDNYIVVVFRIEVVNEGKVEGNINGNFGN